MANEYRVEAVAIETLDDGGSTSARVAAVVIEVLDNATGAAQIATFVVEMLCTLDDVAGYPKIIVC